MCCVGKGVAVVRRRDCHPIDMGSIPITSTTRDNQKGPLGPFCVA